MVRARVLLMTAIMSLLVLGATSRPAPGEVIFSVNFDGMTIGSPPDTGQAMDKPSGYFAHLSTTCLVQQSYGNLDGKPLVFSDSTTAAAAKVWFNMPVPQSQSMVLVEWKSAAGQVARGGEMTLIGDGGAILWMRYDQTGKFYVGHGDGQGQETGSLVAEYTSGAANAFSLLLNLGTRLFSLTIDGVQVMTDRPFIRSNTRLELVMFGTETSEPDPGWTENIYAFDDLRIDVTDVTPARSATWGRLKRMW